MSVYTYGEMRRLVEETLDPKIQVAVARNGSWKDRVKLAQNRFLCSEALRVLEKDTSGLVKYYMDMYTKIRVGEY